MCARGVILLLLLFALVGAGAGYGASRLVPGGAEVQEPETADLVAPGAGGVDDEQLADAQQFDVDQMMAALPEEARRELENDPELETQVRAQLQAAIDSGGMQAGAFGGQPDGAAFLAEPREAAARNTEPLTGTVVSIEDWMLRLETPDGEADLALPPDAVVNVTESAAGAVAYLTEGAEVSVAVRPDGSGGLAAAVIIVNSAGQGGRSGPDSLAAVVTGSITSFADGALTLETADGAAVVVVADGTPVRIRSTAEEAAGELAPGVSVTAFVRREMDGSLSATSVSVGEPE
ncbi:MAG: hypothetical protein OXE02_08490 [Chloroflexi bacterium]|nr:hypothetical protein [Chloroflexota bacterium]